MASIFLDLHHRIPQTTEKNYLILIHYTLSHSIHISPVYSVFVPSWDIYCWPAHLLLRLNKGEGCVCLFERKLSIQYKIFVIESCPRLFMSREKYIVCTEQLWSWHSNMTSVALCIQTTIKN